MKKTLFTLFTVINLVLLYCPAAFALTEDEAAAAVDAQGKDAVSGNLFLWLLCAIAFLKVSTKLDGILHSIGHRRFAFAWLNAVRGIAGFPWF